MDQKRAAAYVRVSTASKAQEHSFEFQEAYWQDEISRNPQYKFVGVYADKGISGKSMAKRTAFNTLIADCLANEVDVVFTKSVQRFARNTTELLTVVRELREKGIAVIFEKENINTLQPNSEMFLTVAAAIAENDLNVYGQNQTWSIRDKFKNGQINVGNGIYGYTLTKENQLIIKEKEAEIIRFIVQSYMEGMSTSKIADALDRRRVSTITGRGNWRDNVIREILKNEKYMGDCLLQKTYRVGGKSVKNHGEITQYYLEDSHTGIISKEDFAKVQELMEKRSNTKLIGQEKTIYPFTGLVKCGYCGKGYVHKINNSGTQWASAMWSCATYLKNGRVSCSGTGIKDSVLKDKFVEAYNEFVRKRYVGQNEIELKSELDEKLKEEQELLALKTKGRITQQAYFIEHEPLLIGIKEVETKLRELNGFKIKERDFEEITMFNEEKLNKFIRKVIIHKWTVTFEFYNGVQVARAYTNGKPGNIKDWRLKQQTNKKEGK